MNARFIPKLARMRPGLLDENHVYIGREYKLHGYSLEASKWGNPFKIGKDGIHTVQEVLERYRRHVLRNPLLMQSLAELRGKTLVCWCHGQVLIELYKEYVAGHKTSRV